MMISKNPSGDALGHSITESKRGRPLLCIALLLLAALLCACVSNPEGATDAAAALLAVQPTPAPYVEIVPNADGSTLDITASGVNNMGGTTVWGNIGVGVGPTGYKEGWTGTYSDTVGGYVFSKFKVTGLTPLTTVTGTFNITTLTGISTTDQIFNRATMLKAAESTTIKPFADSVDEKLRLAVVSAGTLSDDTYVIVLSNQNEPGPRPPDAHLISDVFATNASAQTITTAKPFDLTYNYSDVLNGADPNTLALYVWQPGLSGSAGQWLKWPSQISLGRNLLTASTDLFATYAIFSLPHWETNFDEVEILDTSKSARVTFSEAGELILRNAPDNGLAVTNPITPSFGLTSWESVYYTVTGTSPDSIVTVDLLDANGAVVVAPNVSSGQSLAGIDVGAHPSLRLRAILTATTAISPTLQSWGISWQE